MRTAETWNITNVTFLPKRSKIMYVARQFDRAKAKVLG